MTGRAKAKASPAKAASASDELEDRAVLSPPAATSVRGALKLLQVYQDGTPEVQQLLRYECDLLYECLTCRNIFRSISNLILHKRMYCKGHFKDFLYSVGKEEEKIEAQIKANKATRRSTRKSASKNLNEVLERLSEQNKSTQEEKTPEKLKEGEQKSDSSDSPPPASSSPSSPSPAANEDFEVGPVTLQSIDGSDVGKYQTINCVNSFAGEVTHSIKTELMEIHTILDGNEAILGPDGKVVSFDDSIANAPVGLFCEPCNIRFATRKTYNYHFKYKHNNSRIVYTCPECTDTFATAWSVYRHLCNIHKKTALEVRKLRPEIQTKTLRVDQVQEKKKSSEDDPKEVTEQERKRDENQAWIDDLEGDNDLQRCGGCGRRFERRAALNSHFQICQKRIALRAINNKAKREEKLLAKKLKVEAAAAAAAAAAAEEEAAIATATATTTARDEVVPEKGKVRRKRNFGPQGQKCIRSSRRRMKDSHPNSEDSSEAKDKEAGDDDQSTKSEKPLGQTKMFNGPEKFLSFELEKDGASNMAVASFTIKDEPLDAFDSEDCVTRYLQACNDDNFEVSLNSGSTTRHKQLYGRNRDNSYESSDSNALSFLETRQSESENSAGDGLGLKIEKVEGGVSDDGFGDSDDETTIGRKYSEIKLASESEKDSCDGWGRLVIDIPYLHDVCGDMGELMSQTGQEAVMSSRSAEIAPTDCPVLEMMSPVVPERTVNQSVPRCVKPKAVSAASSASEPSMPVLKEQSHESAPGGGPPKANRASARANRGKRRASEDLTRKSRSTKVQRCSSAVPTTPVVATTTVQPAEAVAAPALHGKLLFDERMSSFTDMADFICLLCNQKFNTIIRLRSHMAVHLEWYRYRCDMCSFKSYEKGVCTSHIYHEHNIHERESIESVLIEMTESQSDQISSKAMVGANTPTAAEREGGAPKKQPKVELVKPSPSNRHRPKRFPMLNKARQRRRVGKKLDPKEANTKPTKPAPDTTTEAKAQKAQSPAEENISDSNTDDKVRKMVLEVIFGESVANQNPSAALSATIADISAKKKDEKLPEAVVSSSSRPVRNRVKPLHKDFIYTFKDDFHGNMDVYCSEGFGAPKPSPKKPRVKADEPIPKLKLRKSDPSDNSTNALYVKTGLHLAADDDTTAAIAADDAEPTTATNAETNVKTNVETNVETNIETSIDTNLEANADKNIETNVDTNIETTTATNSETNGETSDETDDETTPSDVSNVETAVTTGAVEEPAIVSETAPTDAAVSPVVEELAAAAEAVAVVAEPPVPTVAADVADSADVEDIVDLVEKSTDISETVESVTVSPDSSAENSSDSSLEMLCVKEMEIPIN